jgi:S-layer homology domain
MYSVMLKAIARYPKMNSKLNIKKLFRSSPVLLATVSIVTGSLAPFAIQAPGLAQASFSDTQGTWAQTCIAELTQRGIVSGYPDGTFRPNNPVNRAEFAAMVGKAFPNAARTRGPVQFADVSSSNWAANAISNAYQTGFMSGYPGNIFNPEQSIPRAQVLVSLASGLNYAPNQPTASTLGLYADASAIPGYAQNGIAAATERRLVVNYPNVQLLNPNQLASRAEVAAFLCQAGAATGQMASVIPGQYVAGGGAPVAVQRGQVTAGTNIPVKYTDAQRIVVAPNETADLSLTVANDVRDSQGAVAIPAGSLVNGQLVPTNGGSQFVARSVVLNGQAYPINATSGVVQTKRNTRDPNFAQIIGSAALGSGAAAIIGGTTGDRTVNGGNVLLGGTVATAAAANQGRNIISTIRDAAIGAALGAGVSGLTGNRTITPKKVFTGAATGATVGGILDRGNGEVVVINPNSDLNLTVNNNWAP